MLVASTVLIVREDGCDLGLLPRTAAGQAGALEECSRWTRLLSYLSKHTLFRLNVFVLQFVQHW